MSFIDQMGREVILPNVPQRIVSLVPSQTEFLYDLSLEERVVGITKFCIYPEKWFKSKTRIGGTKTIDIEKVKALNPDLIIGNKEENTESDILELVKIAPLWMSDIYTLDDAYSMMLEIGKMCNLEEKAGEIVQKIKLNFLNYKPLKHSKKAIYLIWNEPLMAVGKNTFIDDMLLKFGLKNYYENEVRYPLCEANLVDNVDYILLSSEPFPFNQNHAKDIQALFPKSKPIFVDGEQFSWYGSHLMQVPRYFESLKKEFED